MSGRTFHVAESLIKHEFNCKVLDLFARINISISVDMISQTKFVWM